MNFRLFVFAEVEKFGKDLGVVRLGWCLGCWIDCARVYIGLVRSCITTSLMLQCILLLK
uniref:Uncharacterized protein n=1 Tax=Elaeophora elaphi TaxID=1147741 RepID=A0A0R3RL66_9BILA